MGKKVISWEKIIDVIKKPITVIKIVTKKKDNSLYLNPKYLILQQTGNK